MKAFRAASIAVLALVLCSGCHRQNIRTTVIRVPAMDSDEAALKVIEALAPYREFGIVSDLEPDVPERTVTVVYDSTEVALKNFEYLLARAGFAANDHPALPPMPTTSAQEQP